MSFFRSISKTKKKRVADRDSKLSNSLISEGKECLQKLQAIDQKLLAIQSSTKTSFSFFAPVHNYCRTKYSWYYNWHVKPYATKVHYGALSLIFLVGLSLSYFSLFGSPNFAKAADYSCTWNGGTGNWTDLNWGGGCAGTYPGADPAKSYDVTVGSGGNISITTNNIDLTGGGTTGGMLYISFGTVQFGSGSGNFTASDIALAGSGILSSVGYSPSINVKGSWDSSGGTFNYGGSTVHFNATAPAGKIIKLKAATTTFYDLIFDYDGPVGQGVWTASTNALTVAHNLTINSGATFDPYNQNLTVGGAFSNSGNFGISGTKPSLAHTFSGNWSNSGTYYLSNNATNTITGNTVSCSGTLDATSNGTLTINGTGPTVDFTNCTFNKGTGTLKFTGSTNDNTVSFTPSASDYGPISIASGTFGKRTTLTITNSLKVTSASVGIFTGMAKYGTFYISNRTLTVTGTGTPLGLTTGGNAGTITATGSIINYTGANPTITANVTTYFTKYNTLAISNSGTLAGAITASTLNLTGTLTVGTNTLNVTAGITNNGTITTSNNGGNLNLTPTNVGNVTFTSVATSIPSGKTFDTLTLSTSGGTLTGTTSATTLVNDGSLTVGTNAFSFSSISGSGTIWTNGSGTTLSGLPANAGNVTFASAATSLPAKTYSTLTLAAGGNITAIGTTAATLSIMGILDVGSYMFTVNTTISGGGTIRTDGDGSNLSLPSSAGNVTFTDSASAIPAKTYGTLTLLNNGTLTGNTSATTLDNSGTLTVGTNTVGFRSITGSSTISTNGNGSNLSGLPANPGNVTFTETASQLPAKNYNFLTLDNGGTTSSGTTTVLALTNNGTLNSGSNQLTVNSSISGSGTISTTSYNKLSLPQNAGNVTFSNLLSDDNIPAYSYSTLTLMSSCATSSGTTSATILVNNGTLNTANNQLTITGSISGTGTISTTGTGSTLSLPANAGNLTFTSTASALPVKTYGTLTLQNGGTVKAGATTAATLSNTGTLQISSTTTEAALHVTGNVTNNGSITFPNGDIGVLDVDGNLAAGTIGSNSEITVGGNLNGITSIGSNIIFDGSSNQTFDSGGHSVASITHSGNNTLQLVNNNLDVNGAFVNAAGTFDSNNLNMNFASSWSNTGSATFIRGSGILTFDGSSAITNSSSNATTLGAITISGTGTLGWNLTAASITGGILNMGTNRTLTLSGTGTPLAVTTFQKGTGSTVKYTGTSATNIAAVAYNNLQLSGAATYSLADATSVAGNLTIDSGATLDATSSNRDISVSGSWANSGTFNPRAGTVTFDASSGTKTITAGTGGFNNITFNNSAGEWQLLDTLNASGNFTVTSSKTTGSGVNLNNQEVNITGNFDLAVNGKVTAGSANITVGGNWAKTGAFVPGTSTVTLNGASAATVSGNSTFNNLYLKSAASTAGRTISFAVNSTQAISDTFGIDGSSGKLLTLARSGGSGTDQYIFAPQSNITSGQYINVSNNAVTAGKITPGSYVNVIDEGNNAGWAFDSAPPAAFVPGLSTSDWTNQNITLTFATTDATSDLSHYEVKIDSGSYATQTSPYTINTSGLSDGTHMAYVKALDNAGNSIVETAQFKVDHHSPVTDIIIASPNGNTDSSTHHWYKGSVPIFTFSETADSYSPNSTIYYQWDLSNPIDNNPADFLSYSGQPLSAQESNGNHIIYYFGTDAAGNKTQTYSLTFYVDSNTPTVSSTITGGTANGNGYYTGVTPPSISLSGSDGDIGSGVAKIRYHWDSTGYQDYTTALITDEGTHTLYFYAYDQAGNNQTGTPTNVSSFTIKYSAHTPAVVVTADPVDGLNSWYKSHPAITLTSSSQTPGVTSQVKYKWDNGSYATADSPVHLTASSEGTHTLYYSAVDNSGQTSSEDAEVFKVDTILPVVDISLSKTPDGNDQWYKTAPNITLTATTTGSSGFSAIKYHWDNLAESNYTGVIPASLEGTHVFHYRMIDNGGIDSNAGSNPDINRTIYFDTTAPSAEGLTISTTTPINKLSIPISWNAATDGDGSGVDQYLVYIGSERGSSNIVNGKLVSSLSDTGTFTQEGNYFIRIKAVDNVGNISSFSTEKSILIDLTPPTLIVNPIDETQFINSKTFQISGASSDDSAGVDFVQLKFDDGNFFKATSSDNFATWSYDWKNYTDGNHTLVVESDGKAGNKSQSPQYLFKVDTTPPSLPRDLRVFNISNKSANTLASYLDFASSTDETSQVKTYEVYRDNTKLSEISPVEDSSNPSYTGNKNQPFYLIDKDLKEQSYSYRIKAIDNAGNSSESAAVTIDTTGKQIENDSISEVKSYPSSVVTKEATSATIAWKTTYPATSQVQYGEATSYGKTTDLDENLNQGHSVLLSGLKPNTTYHAKATSKDIYGRETTSEDITFTTKSPEDSQSVIKVIIDTLQSLLKSLRIQAADTNAQSSTNLSSLQETSDNLLLTDISFKEKGLYQNILTFAKSSKVEKSTDNQSFTSINSDNGYYLDKGLNTNANYYYRLDNGKALSRKPAVGDESPLSITDQSVIKESVLASLDKVQLTVFWKTNRGSSSQVDFGPTTSYNKKTKEDLSLNTGHNMIIEDLDPDTTYHFKVTSTDSKGNISTSGDFTYKTPAAQKEKGPFDVILETLQRILGLLKA